MVTSTTSTSSAIGSIFQTNTTSAADSASKLFTDNSEMYLQLFLTQLKNQDPTQPFDTAQMTQQLSQLNTSQQQIEMNKNLEALIEQNKNSQASSLVGFINKEVEYLGDTFYLQQGDSQSFKYFVDKEYQNLTVTVADENGNLIVKYPLKDDQTTVGNHDFTWDGTDSLGNPVPTGTYKVSVSTETADGQFGSASTFLSGIVSGVDFASSTDPVIFVGNDQNRVGVDLSRISTVLNASITSTTNQNTQTNI